MTLKPNKNTVKKVVSGLGYKIEPVKTMPKVKGKYLDHQVILDKKLDEKELLGLSYYSISF